MITSAASRSRRRHRAKKLDYIVGDMASCDEREGQSVSWESDPNLSSKSSRMWNRKHCQNDAQTIKISNALPFCELWRVGTVISFGWRLRLTPLLQIIASFCPHLLTWNIRWHQIKEDWSSDLSGLHRVQLVVEGATQSMTTVIHISLAYLEDIWVVTPPSRMQQNCLSHP